MMKVIHLSSSLTNGAGSAARRINDALRFVGEDSEIWTNGRFQEEIDASVIASRKPIQDRIKSKLNTFLQKKILQADDRLMTTISIQTLDIAKLLIAKPTIINVHSMYNYLNFQTLSLIKRQNIPTVITLHDERFYTGGCHNTFGCNHFENICINCPQGSKLSSGLIEREFRKESKYLSHPAMEIHLVGPSEWVLQQARKSGKFSKCNFHKIPNPVPDLFREIPRQIRSEPFGAANPFHFGFCAADINSPYKGFPVLLNVLLEFSQKTSMNFVLHVAGKGHLDQSRYPFAIKRVESATESDLAEFYRNIDLLIVPSLGDNSPSVISEALLSGTKVIGSRVGGIPEQLNFSEHLLFDVADEQSIASCISRNLGGYKRDEISDEFYSRYCFENVGHAYAKLYESILGK
jgi:glycosyltransferase involved in cell wall biosynthesis